MPDELAVAERTERDAVLDHVGDDGDLGQLRRVRDAAQLLGDRRALEHAEVAAELDERGVVERLVAEDEDEVRMPGGGDRRHRRSVEPPPEIDAADLRAERPERPEDLHLSSKAGF